MHIEKEAKRRKDVSLPLSTAQSEEEDELLSATQTTFFWMPVLFCNLQIPLSPLFEILFTFGMYHLTPNDSVVKNLPTNAGDPRDVGLIPESGRSPEIRKQQPTPVFLPGESHGQTNLASSSPWCHRVEHDLPAIQQH